MAQRCRSGQVPVNTVNAAGQHRKASRSPTVGPPPSPPTARGSPFAGAGSAQVRRGKPGAAAKTSHLSRKKGDCRFLIPFPPTSSRIADNARNTILAASPSVDKAAFLRCSGTCPGRPTGGACRSCRRTVVPWPQGAMAASPPAAFADNRAGSRHPLARAMKGAPSGGTLGEGERAGTGGGKDFFVSFTKSTRRALRVGGETIMNHAFRPIPAE